MTALVSMARAVGAVWARQVLESRHDPIEVVVDHPLDDVAPVASLAVGLGLGRLQVTLTGAAAADQAALQILGWNRPGNPSFVVADASHPPALHAPARSWERTWTTCARQHLANLDGAPDWPDLEKTLADPSGPVVAPGYRGWPRDIPTEVLLPALAQTSAWGFRGVVRLDPAQVHQLATVLDGIQAEGLALVVLLTGRPQPLPSTLADWWVLAPADGPDLIAALIAATSMPHCCLIWLPEDAAPVGLPDDGDWDWGGGRWWQRPGAEDPELAIVCLRHQLGLAQARAQALAAVGRSAGILLATSLQPLPWPARCCRDCEVIEPWPGARPD